MNMVVGGFSSVCHLFGADNWGWVGYEDDLSEAALIVQMWAADGSGTTSATFGEIEVSAVPEPTTFLLWGTTAVGLAAVRR